MMNNKNQLTFTDTELTAVKRITEKAQFLEKINDIIPWDVLEETIAPYYFRLNPAYSSVIINIFYG